MSTAIVMLKSMMGVNGISLSPSVSPVIPSAKRVLLVFCLLVWLLPNTQQWMIGYSPALTQPMTKTPFKWCKNLWIRLQWQPNRVLGIVMGITIFILTKLLLDAPPSEFLYFNF
jgi:hypothetical protein